MSFQPCPIEYARRSQEPQIRAQLENDYDVESDVRVFLKGNKHSLSYYFLDALYRTDIISEYERDLYPKRKEIKETLSPSQRKEMKAYKKNFHERIKNALLRVYPELANHVDKTI